MVLMMLASPTVSNDQDFTRDPIYKPFKQQFMSASMSISASTSMSMSTLPLSTPLYSPPSPESNNAYGIVCVTGSRVRALTCSADPDV